MLIAALPTATVSDKFSLSVSVISPHVLTSSYVALRDVEAYTRVACHSQSFRGSAASPSLFQIAV